MTAERLRFGLIGFGLFGAHHARSIAKSAGGELAGIAAQSDDSCGQAASEFPAARVTHAYRELIEDPAIDVIDVVVPNHLHHEVAAAALRAGKHVLLEKPMALTVEQCQELNRLADDAGVTLAINHELRLSSLWRGAKELVDQGAIGQPKFAMVELSRFPYRQGSQGWRYDPARVGNWILEEPIHFFDLARWYLEDCGEPLSVFAKSNSRQNSAAGMSDHFSALVTHRDDAYALISQSLAAFEHHVTVKIGGTEGMIWGWWSAADARSPKARYGLRYGLGESIQEVTLGRPTGELLELADQIDAVVESIRSGTPPPCTGEDGKWSTALCLAAARSAQTGEAIDLAP